MALRTAGPTVAVMILGATAPTRPKNPRQLCSWILAVLLLGSFEGLLIYLDANGILTP